MSGLGYNHVHTHTRMPKILVCFLTLCCHSNVMASLPVPKAAMSQTCNSYKQLYSDSECCGAADTMATACGPVTTGIMKTDLAPSTVRTYFPVRSSRIAAKITFAQGGGEAQTLVNHLTTSEHVKTVRVGFGGGELGSYGRDLSKKKAVLYMTCDRGDMESDPACVTTLQTHLTSINASYSSLKILNPEDVAGGQSINTYATDTSNCERKTLESVGGWGSPSAKVYSSIGVAEFTLNKSLPEFNYALGAYLNYEHRICTTEGFMLTYTFYEYPDGNTGALVYGFESVYSLDRHVHAFFTYPIGGFATWAKHMITGPSSFGEMLTVVETSSSDVEIDFFNSVNALDYSRVGFDAIGSIDTCEVV